MGTHRVVYLYPWVLLRHDSQIKNAILTWCFDMCIYCEMIEWSSFLFFGVFVAAQFFWKWERGAVSRPGGGTRVLVVKAPTTGLPGNFLEWSSFEIRRIAVEIESSGELFVAYPPCLKSKGHPPYKLSLILIEKALTK